MSAPPGTVSFLDTSNSNYVLGTATLGTGTKHYLLGNNDSPTLPSATAIAVGDFNGDGFLDIVGANDNLSTLIPSYGRGDGTFSAGTPIPTCAAPGSVATGDFNEDGNLDLAVSCPSGVVMILLGRGDGTFSAGASVTTGTGSFSLVTADFNGDGHADLAQANQSTNDVTVLLGHGDGTFTATASNPTTSANPRAAAVGDFDGDGKPDLVISTAGGGSLTLLLGNGDGTFTAGTTPVAGSAPVGVAVGDFDNDGNQDLAVGDGSTNTVTILHGNGDGTFTALPGTLATGSVPSTILVADFDGDSFADIVVGNEIDQTATAFIGNYDGTFAAGITQHAYYGGGTLTYGAVGDFNGDGKADFVVGVSGGTGPLDCILSVSSESSMATLPLTSQVGTGVHLIVASYQGSGIYGPVTSSPIGLQAAPVSTTLALGINPNASQIGQTVTLTATLAPFTAQNHSTNGELVTFKNGGTSVGTGTLQNGIATLSLTSLPAGLNQLSATYAGDTNFTASSSTTYSYPVVNGTTLALNATPTTIKYGTAISMTATLSPYTLAGQTTNSEVVDFYHGTVLVGDAPLVGGIATLTSTTVPAGSGTLTAKYAGDNYFAPSTSTGVSYAVAKATPSITWAPPATATYTGLAFGSLLNASSAVAGSFSYTVTPAGGPSVALLATTVLPAGSYTLTTTFAPTDTTDYTNATSSFPLTVNPATLTLVPVNATRVYGLANPALSGSVTGGLNGDTFTVTGATAATTASPVGSYTITYTLTGANLANYTYAPKTATLTITQAQPTLTWPTPSAISYGTALSSTQLNATASTGGTITYLQPAGTMLTAGSYSLAASFSPTDTTNYKTATATVSLTVTRTSLAVTPSNLSRTYGAANPSLDQTVTGAVNGDVLTLTGATTATATSRVGSYAITYTLTGTNAASYTFTPATGVLTVTQAAATVTWTAPSPIVYGTPLSATQLNATASVPGTFTYQPATGAILGVGTSNLSVTFLPTDSTDYKTSTTTAAITVTPATLTLVPVNASRAYSVVNPPLTASVTGALNGDTFTVTGATSATTTSPVGSYPITYTVTGSNLSNYTYAPQTGTLTITQATPSITWPIPSGITYGVALSATQLNATNTVPGKLTYQQTSGTILTAGSYTLTVNFVPTDTTNYKNATATVPLTVSQAVLTLNAPNLSRAYGEANPDLTGTVTGAVNGDALTLTGTTTATPTSHPNGYTITYVLSGTNSQSYTYTPLTRILTVNQAAVSITWPSPSPIVYGTPLSSIQLNATAPIPGTFTYQTPAGTILGVGVSNPGVTFTPTDALDYKFSIGSTTITVTPAPLTIVPANVSRAYGAQNPDLSGSVTGAVAGDTFAVTGTTAATSTSPVGSYPITYTVTGTALSNYTYTPQTGTLTVTQAQPTVSWTTPSAIVYGTQLSAAQLNATASVPGTFAYAQLAGTVLPAGVTTLSAVFTPTDTADYKPQTTSVSLTVAKAPLALSVNNINRTFGSANPTFTGTVTGGVNGDTFAETFSTTATAASIVGSYPIAPSVAGANLANYAVTATNGVLTVSQAGTATTFALSNSNLTLTATVASLTSETPTGSVGFYVGQTLAGTGTLSNGAASFTMASFPSGNVTLTAQYSGDANFTQSSSPALLVLAVTPATTSLTVSGTGSVTDTLGLAVPPGYVGTVQFSCSGLPKGAACSFSPASLSFTGSSSKANVTLSVQTGTTVAGMLRHSTTVSLAGLLGLPGLLAMAFYRRKNGQAMRGTVFMLLLLCGVGASLISCGGGSTNTTTTPIATPTPTGTSTVQVLATGSGGLSQTTAVTLNVQ